ncbi:adenosine kinase [Epithele typhae]|uniref:adenosine kinase n=1 Tax=Epithele typhae TaxID=378194 RepID=UPI002008CAA6|nr:adenosine kinase [Epithele typhae]KAH9923187.1 adenosine kinase [Epithele typhae]
MMSEGYSLFCMGNPLLDIIIPHGEELLEKYSLEPNGAIRVEDDSPFYRELVDKYSEKVVYVAGGAAQNAARGAAYILPPRSVVYTGSVGNDSFAEQLVAANRIAGVDQVYHIAEGHRTGTCAVVVTGHNRSLVTYLGAAHHFNEAHLSSPTVAAIINSAKVYYVGGFFLSHGIESALELAKKACAAGKPFVLNLSAPFIPERYTTELQSLMPYVDILVGNEAEAEAYASATGLADKTDLAAVARAIASLPKSNPARPRTAIITHGPKATTVVSAAGLDSTRVFPVAPLSDAEIVDTNGAGDAFAGGLLAGLVLGKSIEECVEMGHKMGSMCVQQVGAQYKWPKVQIL